jgi:Thioredoxin
MISHERGIHSLSYEVLTSIFFILIIPFMKFIVLLTTLTLLTSCTYMQTPSSTPIETTSPVTEMPKTIPDTITQSETPQEDMMSGEVMDHSGSDMMKQSSESMSDTTSDMPKPTGYENYDETSFTQALASGQKVALFFHAKWCPSCRSLDKALTSETVPSDAIIFKVDYDTSESLKKKYRVV